MTATAARFPASLVPQGRAARWLVVMFMIDTFGTGLFIAGSAVFFTRHIGLSAGEVALGLSGAGLTGAIAVVPMGLLADRLGVRRVQCGLHLWRAAGFLLYTAVGSFPAFLAVAAMIGVGDRSSPALNQALVALAAEPEQRVRLMSLLRAVKNMFFSLGGLVAVTLLTTASSGAFLALVVANAASFLVVAVAVVKLPLTRDDRGGPRTSGGVPSLRDHPYTALAGLNGVLSLHNSLLMAGLPLYVLHRTDAPDSLVPAFFVVNTILVTLGQVPAGRIAATLRGSGTGLLLGGVLCAAACAVFVGAGAAPASAGLALLVAGVAVLSLGEMVQSAGGWGVSFALAKPDRQAEYLSVFSLGATLETIVGPTAVTFLVMRDGPAGWGALALLLVAAGLGASAIVARAGRRTGIDAGGQDQGGEART
jgi:MFS family permease